MELQKERFQIDDHELTYIDVGQGSPIVLLHGGDDPEGQWDHQIPVLLEAGYRIIYPYFEKPVSLAENAAIVSKLLAHLNVSSVVLVGHSLGGLLAKQIDVSYPEIVKAIVCVDSSAYGKFPQEERGRFDEKTQAMYEKNKDKLAEISRPWDYPSSFNIDLLSRFFAWRKENPRPGITLSYPDTDTPNECEVPLLVFASGSGRVRSEDDEAMALRKQLPPKNAQLVVATNSGHWIHREQPEMFNEKLLEFLTTVTR
ncbi:MAG: alpha/beta hydrolase [Phycisphaerae bacterium]|nr:alpha/beta hydrolase [Phycisphaerae bacterium]